MQRVGARFMARFMVGVMAWQRLRQRPKLPSLREGVMGVRHVRSGCVQGPEKQSALMRAFVPPKKDVAPAVELPRRRLSLCL